MSAILGCIFSYYRGIYFKDFPGAHAPGPPRTLAPAARAKNAFGILFSPPNRKNAPRSLFPLTKSNPSKSQSHFLFVTSSMFKTSKQLMWSVFGLTDLEQMKSHTSLTSDIVAILYLIFLVLSVIMLVNMLVALLNNTYDSVTVG